MMANVLIIDDDQSLCRMLSLSVERIGHSVECVFSLDEGLKAARVGAWDVVFLDVRLPDGNGLEALPAIRSVRSCPEVIIFTGDGDPDGAESAIQQGAWDYVEKPTSMNAMMLPLMRALDYRSAKHQKKVLLAKREGIIGGSPEIEKSLSVVADAAESEKEALIVGETGTGKELFARAIHENSRRTGGGIKGFSPEFVEAITAYPWPGNVRGLLMALETAIDMSRDEPVLHQNHLPSHVRVHVAQASLGKKRNSSQPPEPETAFPENLPSLKQFREEGISAMEKKYLSELMRITAGDIKKACGISGLSRSRLYRLLQDHMLTRID